ncbi:MAG: transposase, partial [Rothia mucilaginosa]
MEGSPDSQDLSWRPERTHTDWLRNTLVVSGPTEEVARFTAAAAGSGVIPWQLDLASLEEEFLLPMAAPPDGTPAISLSGAKLLAKRLREAVALNHQRALARMSTDRSCPFDLHRLLP